VGDEIDPDHWIGLEKSSVAKAEPLLDLSLPLFCQIFVSPEKDAIGDAGKLDSLSS
jgi:hypothetical protein